MRLLPVILLFQCFSAFALTDTLYINKGEIIDTLGDTTAFCSFTISDSLSPHNANIQVRQQDSLHITIFNNDTLTHTFTIDQHITTNNVIPPLSSRTFAIAFPASGTYRYYSDRPYGALLGASGIISVVSQPDIHYFWNLFEVESPLSRALANGSVTAVNSSTYQPNIFTINGHFYPGTTTDSSGFVQQSVGDTINISIVNSGHMEHVLHFHGYHVEILDARYNTLQMGWMKDTFPVKLGEAMTIRLIPHQSGMYPVHDHNLVAVTRSGAYPYGMLTILDIQ